MDIADQIAGDQGRKLFNVKSAPGTKAIGVYKALQLAA